MIRMKKCFKVTAFDFGGKSILCTKWERVIFGPKINAFKTSLNLFVKSF